MTSLTKNLKPEIFFFIADLKTCWVLWWFEQLSITITWQVMQLLRHVQTADLG